MSLYKVIKEEGVIIDGLEFAKEELLDLESDALNVSELLAEGSIIDASLEGEEEAPEEEPTDPIADEPAPPTV